MISEATQQKKQIIKLRKLFIDIQNECKEYVKRYALDKRRIKGLSNRSKSKRLYFLEREEWIRVFQCKVNALQKKAERLGYTGTKKPRDFWLPTIIEHATTIQLVIYPAKAVRKLSKAQARAFAEKHDYEMPSLTDNLIATYSNGRDCKIRVKYNNRIEYYRFTDIAICLCEDKKIPSILKRKDYTLDVIPSQPKLFRN